MFSFFFFHISIASGQRKRFDIPSKVSEVDQILLSYLGFVNMRYWLHCSPFIYVSLFLLFPADSFVCLLSNAPLLKIGHFFMP